MIIYGDGSIDNRNTVAINSGYSHATAIQINADGSYDYVIYMTDDMRTWDNDAIIDASPKQLKEYRIKFNMFKIGDLVKIIKGRKMLNETKRISKIYMYRPNNTYIDIEYLVFEDGTKVQAQNCIIL